MKYSVPFYVGTGLFAGDFITLEREKHHLEIPQCSGMSMGLGLSSFLALPY